MKFLEKDLETIIYTTDRDFLCSRGLYIEGRLIRQKYIGNYGTADLIEYVRPRYNVSEEKFYRGKIVIYELKKDQINIDSFLQAIKYAKGIKDFLKKKGKEDWYRYSICLIGNDIELASPFVYLADFLDGDEGLGLSNLVYSYEADGIYFKPINNYSLKNKGF